MTLPLFSDLNFRRLPAGRMLFAYSCIRSVLDEEREPGLADLLSKAEEAARSLRDLQLKWTVAKRKRSHARGNAYQVDLKFDRAWKGVKSMLDSHFLAGFEDELSAAAKVLNDIMFPRGLAGLTKQPFEIQLSESELILMKLEAEYQKEVALLRLEPYVARLKELAEELTIELSKREVNIKWAEVAEARFQAEEFYAGVIANILGRYPNPHSSDIARRSELLREVRRQNDLVIRNYRRRRNPADIHPQTGELLREEFPE